MPRLKRIFNQTDKYVWFAENKQAVSEAAATPVGLRNIVRELRCVTAFS